MVAAAPWRVYTPPLRWSQGAAMGDDMVAILMALATENAELRGQLAQAQDMLVETAIDAGNLHALIEAVQIERDAWQAEAEALRARLARSA